MEGMELTAQSIYGSAKASQEADNIIILQSNQGKSGLLQGKKYIQVVKNRFDGELGIVPLNFDKDSQSYVKKEKSKSEAISGVTLAKIATKMHPPAPAALTRPPKAPVVVTNVDTADGDADGLLEDKLGLRFVVWEFRWIFDTFIFFFYLISVSGFFQITSWRSLDTSLMCYRTFTLTKKLWNLAQKSPDHDWAAE